MLFFCAIGGPFGWRVLSSWPSLRASSGWEDVSACSHAYRPYVRGETLLLFDSTTAIPLENSISALLHPPPRVPRRPAPAVSFPKNNNNGKRHCIGTGGGFGRDCHPRDLHAGGLLRERVGSGHLRPQADRRQPVPLARAGGLPAGEEP